MTPPRDPPDPIFEAAFGIEQTVRPDEDDWVRLDNTNCPRTMTTTLGRQQRLTDVDVGEMVLTVDDRDARLDPTNTASPHFGDWDIATRVRVRGDFGGADIRPMFEGFVEELDPDWNLGDATVKIVAVDQLARLATVQLPRSVLAYEQSLDNPVGWWPLGEDTGFAVDDIAGVNDGIRYYEPAAPGDPLAPYDPLPSATFIGANARFVDVATFPGLDSPFTVEFLMQADPLIGNVSGRIFEQGGRGVAQTGIRVDQLGTLPSGTAGLLEFGIHGPAFTTGIAQTTVRVDDNQPHHIVCTYGGSTMKIYVDGGDVTNVIVAPGATAIDLTSTALAFGVQAVVAGNFYTGQLGHIAGYATALSASRIGTHYQAIVTAWDDDTPGARINRFLQIAGVAVADRDLDAGTDHVGPARMNDRTALEGCNEVALTDQGIFYASLDGKLVYRGRPAPALPDRIYDTARTAGRCPVMNTRPVYSVARVVNRAEVRRVDGLPQIVDDTPSRVKYGAHDQTYETVHRTAIAARQMALDVVTTYGAPRLLFEQIEVNARDGDADLDAVLPDLGEIVAVVGHPPGRAELSQNSTIERVEQHVDWRDWSWKTVIGVEARGVGSYWIWDVTEWDAADHRWSP